LVQSIRYSCQILIKLYFQDTILKNPQISNFVKISPFVASLFYVDRHIDVAETSGRFPQFYERDHKFLPLHAIETLFLVFTAHNIINILNEIYQL